MSPSAASVPSPSLTEGKEARYSVSAFFLHHSWRGRANGFHRRVPSGLSAEIFVETVISASASEAIMPAAVNLLCSSALSPGSGVWLKT